VADGVTLLPIAIQQSVLGNLRECIDRGVISNKIGIGSGGAGCEEKKR
jgi:hypothetical protein